MKFAIITHVVHNKFQNRYFGYAPYVREMNIWLKFVDELIIVAPLKDGILTAIDLAYTPSKIHFYKVPIFNFINFKNSIYSVFQLPTLFWQIFQAMRQADHIHLRCPGNVGLLGCIVQIVFPGKPKTAKYAGNWDPKAKQPWSYRLQKWILSNTFLTRNMQVLTYGEWGGSTKNIKPFFTATYSELDKVPMEILDLKDRIKFVFVGTLSKGKNPLYAIQLVSELAKKGYKVTLEIYGEGIVREQLERYIIKEELHQCIILHGNQNAEVVKKAYQNSHFVILPSKSEGWPKALAEGMFWGCVPIATTVSCVPFMLDYGERGVLLQMNLEQDIQQLETVLNDETDFETKREKASHWSRKYTLDVFEDEIKKMLQ
jgi:glycosyltransferase involved in cell wall biosynthesis